MLGKVRIVRAWMLKKVCEIHFVFAIGVLFEAYCNYQSFVLFCFDIAAEKCVMHAAEVDEVERCASHYEKRFKIVLALGATDVADDTAALCYLELTHAYELSVDICAVREAIGIKIHGAIFAVLFLLVL